MTVCPDCFRLKRPHGLHLCLGPAKSRRLENQSEVVERRLEALPVHVVLPSQIPNQPEASA